MRRRAAAGSIALAVLLLSSCDRICPSGTTRETGDGKYHEYTACVDDKGRYQGPASGSDEIDGLIVHAKANYDEDTPSGGWTCTRGDETLSLSIDAVKWRKLLWKRDEPVGQIHDKKHVGPYPANVCPPGDWSRLSEDGIIVGMDKTNMTELGIMTVTGYTASK